MASSLTCADAVLQHSIAAMYDTTSDDHGTVQVLACDLDETQQDGMLV